MALPSPSGSYRIHKRCRNDRRTVNAQSFGEVQDAALFDDPVLVPAAQEQVADLVIP